MTPQTKLPTTTLLWHPFSGLEPNTFYRFCVRATSTAGEGDDAVTVSSTWASATATTKPAMPSGLTVTEVTDTSARLHWDDVIGATGYKIRLDGVTSTVETVNRGNSHPLSSLTSRTAHELEVAASNSSGDSEFANLTLLLPPTGLTSTPTQDSITLSWTALAGLTYEVKLGAGSAESADDPSSHTFGPLTSDTPFTLYVRARNAQGPSARASNRSSPSSP